MAAGTTIQLKRKAGAFTTGQLAAGEAGVDTTNGDFYFSTDGSDVVQVDVSEIGGGGGSPVLDADTVSDDADLPLDNLFTGTGVYEIELNNIDSADDAVDLYLYLRNSTPADIGSLTYNYYHDARRLDVLQTPAFSHATMSIGNSAFALTNNLGNDTAELASLQLTLTIGTNHTHLRLDGFFMNNGGQQISITGGTGMVAVTGSTVKGARLVFDSGNLSCDYVVRRRVSS